MNEMCTTSILERVPAILAVTAASYGLPLQSREQRPDRKPGSRQIAALGFASRLLEPMSAKVALQH